MGPPLLPLLRLRRIRQRRLPRLPATPPHFALAVELRVGLEERALAASTLAGAEPLAHREVQGGPSPHPPRLARAFPASPIDRLRLKLAYKLN